MKSFWPSKDEFLSKPQKVSRLFIVLFIFSATLSALLGITYGYREYSWQMTERRYDQLLESAQDLAKKYKAERDDLQISVAEKNIQIKEVNAELAKVKKDLTSAEQELSSLNERIKVQEAQLSSNSEELEALRGRPPLFSFENLTSRDVATDQADVREIVTKAYDIIAEIYGDPYLLSQIKISFVDALNISGAVGEINIANTASGIEITIRLTNFDKNDAQDVNTIVHEIIHGFHGIAAIYTPVLEEGITVAATDVVMKKMYERGIINFDSPFIVISDEQAAQVNANYPTPSSNQSFYSSSNVGVYYQLAGWVWYQFYEENNNFFKTFNNKLYDQVQNGTLVSNQAVRDMITSSIDRANGQSISDFVANQIILNPS